MSEASSGGVRPQPVKIAVPVPGPKACGNAVAQAHKQNGPFCPCMSKCFLLDCWSRRPGSRLGRPAPESANTVQRPPPEAALRSGGAAGACAERVWFPALPGVGCCWLSFIMRAADHPTANRVCGQAQCTVALGPRGAGLGSLRSQSWRTTQAQARRANGVRLPTNAGTRPCLAVGWLARGLSPACFDSKDNVKLDPDAKQYGPAQASGFIGVQICQDLLYLVFSPV